MNKTIYQFKRYYSSKQTLLAAFFLMLLLYPIENIASVPWENGWKDGSLQPKSGTPSSGTVTIDMERLFNQGMVGPSTWENTYSKSTKVVVSGYKMLGVIGKVCPDGQYNYFTTVAQSDDPTMRLSHAPFSGVVAENDFLKIELSASIGIKKEEKELPWSNFPGPGSNTGLAYPCGFLATNGIYAGLFGKYRITKKKNFSIENAFHYLDIYFFGARDIYNSSGKNPPIGDGMVDITQGNHFSVLRINFVNWYTPYTCSLGTFPVEVEFPPMSSYELINKKQIKSFSITPVCSGGQFDRPELDDKAVSLKFINTDTETGSDYFYTRVNNELNKNLVFKIQDVTNSVVPVKNNEKTHFILDKYKAAENTTPYSYTTRRYQVYPEWRLADPDTIPTGPFESSGIIYLEME